MSLSVNVADANSSQLSTWLSSLRFVRSIKIFQLPCHYRSVACLIRLFSPLPVRAFFCLQRFCLCICAPHFLLDRATAADWLDLAAGLTGAGQRYPLKATPAQSVPILPSQPRADRHTPVSPSLLLGSRIKTVRVLFSSADRAEGGAWERAG